MTSLKQRQRSAKFSQNNGMFTMTEVQEYLATAKMPIKAINKAAKSADFGAGGGALVKYRSSLGRVFFRRASNLAKRVGRNIRANPRRYAAGTTVAAGGGVYYANRRRRSQRRRY